MIRASEPEKIPEQCSAIFPQITFLDYYADDIFETDHAKY